MDEDGRRAIIAELSAGFGAAKDVTPASGQPLHALLPSLKILAPWRPSPTRGLVLFEGWPGQRPLFWIDLAVVNSEGHPPRSNGEQLVLGEAWRSFSFSFPWPVEPTTPTRAVQAWLNRFREPT
jgi:hypothetical protein